jgi:hypothetical protein
VAKQCHLEFEHGVSRSNSICEFTSVSSILYHRLGASGQ